MTRRPAHSAASFLPGDRDLRSLAEAARTCAGCPLFANATQTVFGEGPATARVVLVGEQPGDREDLAGRPFVGPAGRLLDEALAEAGVDRGDVYLTNAVKHFKFVPQGTRRLHQKPTSREMAACRPWLDAEIAALRPEIVVCLGATAAQSLLGRDFRITRQRGEFLAGGPARWTLATYHPAAVLRAPDEAARTALRTALVDDLRKVAAGLASLAHQIE